MDIKKYFKLTIIVIIAWIIALPVYFLINKHLNLEKETTLLTPAVILFIPLVVIIFGELINSKIKKKFL